MLEEGDIEAIRIELEQAFEKYQQSDPFVALDLVNVSLLPRLQAIEERLSQIMELLCAHAGGAHVEVEFNTDSETKVKITPKPKTSREDSNDED